MRHLRLIGGDIAIEFQTRSTRDCPIQVHCYCFADDEDVTDADLPMRKHVLSVTIAIAMTTLSTGFMCSYFE